MPKSHSKAPSRLEYLIVQQANLGHLLAEGKHIHVEVNRSTYDRISYNGGADSTGHT